MLGSTVVTKAAKKGYKRYGIPGAVVAGAGTFLGIRFVKRRFLSGGGNDSDADATTDAETGTETGSESGTGTDTESSTA